MAAAGFVTVALTAAGFWLSYAHLAEIAGHHGLGGSPVRQWAWPATLDAFIIAGELLMLRASLRRITDWWAIALTATGSLGSIALNVAGVAGTRGAQSVPVMNYVVAAVPPAAALLAFGVIMRQIHQHLLHPTPAPAPASAPTDRTGRSTSPDAYLPQPDTSVRGPHPDPTDTETETALPAPDTTVEPLPEPAVKVETEPGRNAEVERQADDGPRKTSPPTVPARRVGRPTSGDLEDFLPIVAALGREPTLQEMRTALSDAGHPISNDRLGKLKKLLADHHNAALTEPPLRH
ncbi:DUF2637 domain-containing protein [Streptomyces virginiae]